MPYTLQPNIFALDSEINLPDCCSAYAILLGTASHPDL
jgi:hypothetical protein